jgi:hypothetical protein
VTATDRNGRSGFALFKVRITDVNDNAPAFDLVRLDDEIKSSLN